MSFLEWQMAMKIFPPGNELFQIMKFPFVIHLIAIISSISSVHSEKVTGSLRTNWFMRRSQTFKFNLPVNMEVTIMLTSTSLDGLTIFTRRDKPVVLGFLGFGSFHDSKTSIVNYPIGDTNCDDPKISPSSKLYVTVSSEYPIFRSVHFTFQTLNIPKNCAIIKSDAAILSYLSESVYGKNEVSMTESLGYSGDCLSYKKISVMQAVSTSSYAELWINTNTKIAILVFRGTMDFKNFISDISVAQVKCKLGDLSDCGKIHSGFLKAYKSLKLQIIKALSKIDKSYTLKMTAHSLGAAIATLASYDLIGTRFAKQSITTFGSPSVGNFQFFNAYRNFSITHNIEMTRFVRRQVNNNPFLLKLDKTTTIAEMFGYQHVVTPTHYNSNSNYGLEEIVKLHSTTYYFRNMQSLL